MLFALILIAIGVLFLASNLGWISGSIGTLLATWWPLGLVIIGLVMLLERRR